MSLFDDTLQDDQTVFKNHQALDFDYLPKKLPYRENEQEYIATAIKPLLRGRDGKNVFVHGEPGIGKTAASRFVLDELRQRTDRVQTVFVNCWEKNTSYKILMEICEQLDYHFTHNKQTAELLSVVSDLLSDAPAVFVFDEIDKVDDYDFLYGLSEGVEQFSAVLITNNESWLSTVDQRLRSRIMPEQLGFEAYSFEETKGILERRVDYAFFDGVWPEEPFLEVVRHASRLNDIRSGLFLLREAATRAEDEARKQVTTDDVDHAVDKLDEFTIKDSADLENEKRAIYHFIKQRGPGRIGDLHDEFVTSSDHDPSYKTFQRKVKDLASAGFIERTRSTGEGGNTTILEVTGDDIP